MRCGRFQLAGFTPICSGGGGGGGGSYSETFGKGGNGGRGVLIVRYADDIPTEFESVSQTGAKVSMDGDYVVCTFTNNGTFTVNGDSRVDVLLVGGGGGGGSFHGGGGGGGGVVQASGKVLYSGTYQIKVGAGGAGSAVIGENGANGGESLFDVGYECLTAFGGGGGAGVANAAYTGKRG